MLKRIFRTCPESAPGLQLAGKCAPTQVSYQKGRAPCTGLDCSGTSGFGGFFLRGARMPPLMKLSSAGQGFHSRRMNRRKTAELERQALTEALRRTGGNKAKAARLLQIDYTTIHAKLKQAPALKLTRTKGNPSKKKDNG